MEEVHVDHSLEKFGCKGDTSGNDVSRVCVLFCSFWKGFMYVMELIERTWEPEVENRREKG